LLENAAFSNGSAEGARPGLGGWHLPRNS
jgi:hypothetical protein